MAENNRKKNIPVEEQNAVQNTAQMPTGGQNDAEAYTNIPIKNNADIKGLYQQRMGINPVQSDGMPIDASRVMAKAIGREQVLKAAQTLQKYRQGKSNLDKRIVENEEWYKLRHWECMRDKKREVEPASAWLFNCIIAKHADAMDNFPSPNILPREEGDKEEAKMLSSIVPVVLDQCDFEQTYSDVWNYKLKAGTGVYGVFWDKSKLNGLGDISIQKVDLLNLFWQPGITDIQKSRNIFHLELMDNELLEEAYPQLTGKLGSRTVDVARYIYDDSIDTSEKSMVVDWYYKKNVNGKQVLHYCKFVNDEVLFATENEPQFAERGWYDHGQYPFVFDALYPSEGTPTGYSYIDIGKDCQTYIDRINQAIIKNTMANSRPRYFINAQGAVNEAEFADLTKDLVHVDGNLGADSIMPIKGDGLSSIYVQVLASKIDELKETTGNRDITNGGAESGMTAASAIAATQESAGKLSRDTSKAAYRAYRKIVLMVIELIRQFYDFPRQFRIVGEKGSQEFVMFSNQGIQPQKQEGLFGIDAGYRLPLFDIEVTAQKQSAYSKLSQNELALQFYQLGFFNPQMADQSLACLDMMDFDRKSFIMSKIAENGTMYQMLMQMQQQLMALGSVVDGMRGGNEITSSLAQQFGMEMPAQGNAQQGELTGSAKEKGARKEAMGGTDEHSGEATIVKKARESAANRTSPT